MERSEEFDFTLSKNVQIQYQQEIEYAKPENKKSRLGLSYYYENRENSLIKYMLNRYIYSVRHLNGKSNKLIRAAVRILLRFTAGDLHDKIPLSITYLYRILTEKYNENNYVNEIMEEIFSEKYHRKNYRVTIYDGEYMFENLQYLFIFLKKYDNTLSKFKDKDKYNYNGIINIKDLVEDIEDQFIQIGYGTDVFKLTYIDDVSKETVTKENFKELFNK